MSERFHWPLMGTPRDRTDVVRAQKSSIVATVAGAPKATRPPTARRRSTGTLEWQRFGHHTHDVKTPLGPAP